MALAAQYDLSEISARAIDRVFAAAMVSPLID